MYGIWLLVLFVILPAGAGAALAYVVSREERPSRKVLAIGAAVGAVIGIAVGLLLTRT
jgi:formate hydrogenlyase subunit 3/multisubunit Na+/H+ antiporter MnhD subunit